MKKIFIVFLLPLFLLTGCFESENTDNNELIAGFKLITADAYSIQIPQEWEIIEGKNLPAGVSANTLAAYRSNVKNQSFIPNVVVLATPLSAEITSLDYAKALNQKIGADLTDFRVIKVEDYKIKIGSKEDATYYINVEGRSTPSEELKEFVAVTGVKNKYAFTIMGSFLSNAENSGASRDTVENIVKTFALI